MKSTEILKQIIESRKSSFPKDYTEDEIPEIVLQEILDSAQFAPNHKRTKPWRFQVFKNEEKTKIGKELQKIYREITPESQFLEKKYQDIGNKISKSNVLISISVNFSGLLPEWEEIAATAMAVQNMYLMCSAHDIGCYWSSPKLIEQMGGFLELKENQKCFGFFYMGKI